MDAGAPCVDITQDAQGVGEMEARLSVELANTPVIPCWHFARILQQVNIHSDKQANIRIGSTLHTPLNAMHCSADKADKVCCWNMSRV